MVADLVFAEKLEEKDKEKRTMGMHDGWLGKDPSTALEDGEFANTAKMSECVCVFLLRSRKQPGGPSRGNSSGEIKAAGSYQ